MKSGHLNTMKTQLRSILTTAFLLGTLTFCANAQPKKMPNFAPPTPPQNTKIIRDLAYIPDGSERHKLDLYLPPDTATATGSLPLIVYVHGGAFMFGDRNSAFLPVRLLSRGYAIASLDYRLSGDAPFPAQIEDCKAAVRWLRAHAAQYNLDANRFASWGESAGGNLAALLGTAGASKTFDVGANLEYSSAVQGVVDLYGPTDFLQMDAHRLPGGDQHNPADSPESRLIGGALQKNKAKVERANPISYVSGATPPFFIAHGKQDHVVPLHQSQLLVVALVQAGVPVNFLPVSGADHGFKNATPAQLQQIDNATDAFLKELFGTPR